MSRKQWIGLLILLLMAASVELCVRLTDRRLTRQSSPELLVFRPEREETFLHYLDSCRQADYRSRQAQYASQYPRPEIRLQPFDPNTADSTLLVTVGLKPYMARNLIRYRQAGKVFRRADDLRRLYGMTDSLYSSLAPYIRIDSVTADSLSGRLPAVHESTSERDTLYASDQHLKRDTVLELNTADTAELQLLRGIGRFTAVKIVHYRQELGGYYSVNQLYEIKELHTERIDSLLPHLVVDTTLIEPIDVNRASVRRLYRHPYISYRQAEQLYDLRRRKTRLHTMSELTGIFTPDELQRLHPYLRFDSR